MANTWLNVADIWLSVANTAIVWLNVANIWLSMANTTNVWLNTVNVWLVVAQHGQHAAQHSQRMPQFGQHGQLGGPKTGWGGAGKVVSTLGLDLGVSEAPP